MWHLFVTDLTYWCETSCATILDLSLATLNGRKKRQSATTGKTRCKTRDFAQ